VKILIADDEGHARQRLRALLQEIDPGIEVVGEAANGIEALRECEQRQADLVLMDIRMPGMDGLEAAAELAGRQAPPAVVFVTAYDEHALAAFERNAVDYLLKPIRRRQLEKALAKAAVLTRPQLLALQALQKDETVYVSGSQRGGIVRIALDDVFYFMADQKYVTACHAGGEALLEESLKSLEERFGSRLLRVHRNALIVRQRLQGLKRLPDGRCLVSVAGSGQPLEVSRRHIAEVRRLLKGE
jgi:two-component system response regulator AlgR